MVYREQQPRLLLISALLANRGRLLDRRCSPQKSQHRRLVCEDCTSSNRYTIVKEVPTLSGIKPRLSSAMVSMAPNERARATCDCDHTHLIKFAHACGYHLSSRCGYQYYSSMLRVATIRINTIGTSLAKISTNIVGAVIGQYPFLFLLRSSLHETNLSIMIITRKGSSLRVAN